MVPLSLLSPAAGTRSVLSVARCTSSPSWRHTCTQPIALAAGNDDVGDRDQLVDDRGVEIVDLHAEATVGQERSGPTAPCATYIGTGGIAVRPS